MAELSQGFEAERCFKHFNPSGVGTLCSFLMHRWIQLSKLRQLWIRSIWMQRWFIKDKHVTDNDTDNDGNVSIDARWRLFIGHSILNASNFEQRKSFDKLIFSTHIQRFLSLGRDYLAFGNTFIMRIFSILVAEYWWLFLRKLQIYVHIVSFLRHNILSNVITVMAEVIDSYFHKFLYSYLFWRLNTTGTYFVGKFISYTNSRYLNIQVISSISTG